METSKKHLGIWEYEKIWRVEEVNLDRNQLMMVEHWGMIFGFKKGEIQSMIVITYMITATLIRAKALDGTAPSFVWARAHIETSRSGRRWPAPAVG